MLIPSNAKNFSINNSLFTNQSTDNTKRGPTGIDILLEASCPGAAHESSMDTYSPRCFPGTREQYIQDIITWVIPTLDAPTSVYWMKGPAGVGKSTVAQTCAEELKDQEKLGAAFFFSICGRDKPEEFFPSIAYQLSTFNPAYRDLIDNKIRQDKTLLKRTMSFQFRVLIEEPLGELEAQGKGIGKRIAVIVDGLDECKGVDAQCEIIQIIALAASEATLPLCWIFFSRPEPHIEATFAQPSVSSLCHKVILPISSDADGEIEMYLMNGFGNIIKRLNISTESQWPSYEEIGVLVGAAGGSFIYATTVLRFVNFLGSIKPQKRLGQIIDIILGHREPVPDAHAPFAELDTLYRLVLQRIPSEILPSVHLLLALVCRWGSLGAVLGANILGVSKDELEVICSHTSAVIHLQDPGEDLTLDPTTDTTRTYTHVNRDALKELVEQVSYSLGGRISSYHRSFNDFLLDPARSGSYCVKGSELLAKHFLKMRLSYDQTYCWSGSQLVLPPGVADSASSLSYPYTNELVNSIIKVEAYIEFGSEDSGKFSALGGSEALGAYRDFRKQLHVVTCLQSADSLPRTGQIWGYECRSKSYPGTLIIWASLAGFDINEFKLMVNQRKRAKVIQRYSPKFSSRIKGFFRDRTRKRFESALYRLGHDEKSIFWYWEIDYESGYYRHFQTIDLAKGKKIFREEDFDSWPEWGYEFEPDSETGRAEAGEVDSDSRET